jgi:hypothetical protein
MVIMISVVPTDVAVRVGVEVRDDITVDGVAVRDAVGVGVALCVKVGNGVGVADAVAIGSVVAVAFGVPLKTPVAVAVAPVIP